MLFRCRGTASIEDFHVCTFPRALAQEQWCEDIFSRAARYRGCRPPGRGRNTDGCQDVMGRTLYLGCRNSHSCCPIQAACQRPATGPRQNLAISTRHKAASAAAWVLTPRSCPTLAILADRTARLVRDGRRWPRLPICCCSPLGAEMAQAKARIWP